MTAGHYISFSDFRRAAGSDELLNGTEYCLVLAQACADKDYDAVTKIFAAYMDQSAQAEGMKHPEEAGLMVYRFFDYHLRLSRFVSDDPQFAQAVMRALFVESRNLNLACDGAQLVRRAIAPTPVAA